MQRSGSFIQPYPKKNLNNDFEAEICSFAANIRDFENKENIERSPRSPFLKDSITVSANKDELNKKKEKSALSQKLEYLQKKYFDHPELVAQAEVLYKKVQLDSPTRSFCKLSRKESEIARKMAQILHQEAVLKHEMDAMIKYHLSLPKEPALQAANEQKMKRSFAAWNEKYRLFITEKNDLWRKKGFDSPS